MSDFEERLKKVREQESNEANDFESRLEALRKQDTSSSGFRDEDESWYTEAGRGLGLSLAKTGVGLADLVGLADPHAKKALELWEKDIEEGSGWGDAGKIVGDIGQFAVPGTAVYKGAKALGKGAGAIAGGEAGVGALLGGARMPTGDETRLGSAAEEAALSLAGSGLLSAGGKAIQGMKRSEAGQRLMDLMPEAQFTPATVLESSGIKNIQRLLENMPFTSNRAVKAVGRDKENFNIAALRANSADPARITKPGTEGFKQLKDEYDFGYEQAWNQVDKVPEEFAIDMSSEINDILKSKSFLNDQEVSIGDGLVEKNILDKIKNRADNLFLEQTPNGMKNLDNYIRTLYGKTNPSTQYELRGALKEIKNLMRDGLPETVQNQLKSLDSGYGGVVALEDATKKARKDLASGVFDEKQLMSGVEKASSSFGEFASGGGPLSEIADVGKGAFKSADVESEAPIMSLLWRMAKGVPGASVLPFGTASSLITGQTAGQKALQNMLKKSGERTKMMGQVGFPTVSSSLFDTSWMED